MEPLQILSFAQLYTFLVADMAKALAQRPEETKSDQFARTQAASQLILGLLPRDLSELMLAGHAVMFHMLLTDSTHQTLRGEVAAARRGTRANVVSLDRCFHQSLDRLERYQARPSEGRRVAANAEPANPAVRPEGTFGVAQAQYGATQADLTAQTQASATPARGAPAPVAPAPTTSTSATPAPATLAPATPASATPASATPASATPAPATPASATPAPATPTSATPASATPASATPAPATPAPATPAPATPAPATPAPAAPAPAAPATAYPDLPDDVILFKPTPEQIAAVRANPEAMAALQARDPERLARALGLDLSHPTPEQVAAVRANPRALAALEAGDSERFVRIMANDPAGEAWRIAATGWAGVPAHAGDAPRPAPPGAPGAAVPASDAPREVAGAPGGD